MYSISLELLILILLSGFVPDVRKLFSERSIMIPSHDVYKLLDYTRDSHPSPGQIKQSSVSTEHYNSMG